MSYNPTANPPAYVSDDQIIEKGSRVRLKIVGTRTDVNEIYAMYVIFGYYFIIFANLFLY